MVSHESASNVSSGGPFGAEGVRERLASFSSGELPATWNAAVLASVGVLLLLWLVLPRDGNQNIKAPYVGSKNPLWTRMQFLLKGWELVYSGHLKFKNQVFKVIGGDIVVLPTRFIEELHNLPDSKISSIKANVKNFQGKLAGANILLESNLHTHMLQTKVTPQLALFTPGIVDELQLALKDVIGDCDDGPVDLNAYATVLAFVSRISARVFVGFPLCRNKDWLDTSLQYVNNALTTMFMLRCFPDAMKPALTWLLPTAWKTSSAIKGAIKLIGHEVESRRQNQKENPHADKPFDFLQFMMDNASPHDGQPHKLAHRQLILSLGSIHVTSVSCCQILFDVVSRPEYVPELREELETALRECGGWNKEAIGRLRKMDSFMREALSLSPPSVLGFKRIVQEPIQLSDGTVLPKDADVMVVVAPLSKEEATLPNELPFDGFRHYRKWKEAGGKGNHSFATTSLDNLHFGHGRYACPGRFLASDVIKMMLGHWLLNYDLEFVGDKTRPVSTPWHEIMFPDFKKQIRWTKRNPVV